MRQIKLLRNVAFAAATTIMTATGMILTSCSCSSKNEGGGDEPDPIIPEEPVLTSINVHLPQTFWSVEEGESIRAQQSIQTDCYDQNGEEFDAETKLFLETSDDKPHPNWVWIDENNKINIKAPDEAGKYDFKVFAFDTKETIKSNVEYFSVNVVQERIVAPEYINITCEEMESSILTTQEYSVLLGLEVYSKDVPEDVICKKCDWTITKIEGPKQWDLAGNPLFKLDPYSQDCYLIPSQNIDSNYKGEYIIHINAESIMAPHPTSDIELKMTIIDGFNYVDEVTNYEFARTSIGDNWELVKLPSNHKSLDQLHDGDLFLGSPVDRITDDLCSKSGITELGNIWLPKEIKTIGKRAFKDQLLLTQTLIPGVEVVEESAFDGCKNMELSGKANDPCLVYVGKRAFAHCYYLKFRDDTVHRFKFMGTEAFFETSVKEINLGANLEEMEDRVFESTRIAYITIMVAKPPILNKYLFTGSFTLKSLMVPKDSVQLYKNATNWSRYASVIVGY